MPREPKILTHHQLRHVLQDWNKPLETLSKHQLVQVLVATREILKKNGEELHENEHRTCNHNGCHQKPIAWRCEEHAGEPPPPVCDECDAHATKCLCDAHGKPPECNHCNEEADTHTCEKHSRVTCEHCDRDAEASYCDEHNPAHEPEALLKEIIKALREPVPTEPSERLWRRHNIERAIENAGFTPGAIYV